MSRNRPCSPGRTNWLIVPTIAAILLALSACGSTAAVVSPQTVQDIPPLAVGVGPEGQRQEYVSERVPVRIGKIDVMDAAGRRLSDAQLKGLGVVRPQSSLAACAGGTSISSYWWSRNVYGRVHVSCSNPGGKFDTAEGSVSMMAPDGSWAFTRTYEGVGSGGIAVISDAGPKLNGYYFVSGYVTGYFRWPADASGTIWYGTQISHQDEGDYHDAVW